MHAQPLARHRCVVVTTTNRNKKLHCGGKDKIKDNERDTKLLGLQATQTKTFAQTRRLDFWPPKRGFQQAIFAIQTGKVSSRILRTGSLKHTALLEMWFFHNLRLLRQERRIRL